MVSSISLYPLLHSDCLESPQEHPLLKALLLLPRLQLLPGARLGRAEDQLRLEHPLLWNVERLSGADVRQRVVVLQVGAEALGLECGPEVELVHGVGVLAPAGEAVCIDGQRLLQGGDGGRVFVEEDLREKGQVSGGLVPCLLMQWTYGAV